MSQGQIFGWENTVDKSHTGIDCYSSHAKICLRTDCPTDCSRRITKAQNNAHYKKMLNKQPDLTDEGIIKGLVYMKQNKPELFRRQPFYLYKPELIERAKEIYNKSIGVSNEYNKDIERKDS